MNNNNDKTNQLIELIYDSALEPSRWTDLLNALAELVDQVEKESDSTKSEHSLLSAMPNLNGSDEKESHASLSETLKSITDINEEEVLPEIKQANDLLLGHFARALKIAKRLVDIDEQHNIVLSLLDRMPIALVLLDTNAQVIETNALADELLVSAENIRVNKNVLDVGVKNNNRLLELVHKMSKHDSAITQGQSLSIINPHSESNTNLFIAPLQKMDLKQSASVAVFISQQKTQPFSLPKEFSRKYSLTKKEVEITQLLVKGHNVNEISDKQNVSAHTVRSQVKSVMNKTSTSRQAELVSLVYEGMGDFVKSIRNTEDGDTGILSKSKFLERDYSVLELQDGRHLAYAEYGDLNGEPIFHCHSVLGSRLEIAFDAKKILAEKSARLIVIDRPGYGASDPNPKASFVGWVKDLEQLADHLNIKKFSMTGYAMGGLYALACAHEIPHRLNQVAVISTGMPPESVKDYETIIPLYKMNTRLAKYMPKVYCLLTSILVKGILSEPATFFKQFNDYLEPADKKIMNSDRFKNEMFSSLIEGFNLGGKAAAKEVVQYMDDWGFKLEDISITIDIWHGSGDHHVPLALSKRFTKNIKETNLFVKEGQGHYMFYTYWSKILDKLLIKK